MFKVKLLVMFLALAMISVLPAGAWMGPDYIAGSLPLAAITPYGTVGSGIYETDCWTTSGGASTVSDSFASNVISPFGGGAFFDPCFSPCGFGAGPSCGGLAQSGLGGNQGAQQSETATRTSTTAFGIGPLPGLVFGIPVAGPAGLTYC
ncbi:hypothetical protein [Methanocella sp. MCL-LM]|uniref:hypothetical protein n=1 Tax=Methanocella sp. MCL-LM TaxID=3412035 RepID=UPI003C72F7AF